MTLDILSEWREELSERHGVGVAHKVIKEWRRHWRVMLALRVAIGADPSLGIRNSAPPPRWQTWREARWCVWLRRRSGVRASGQLSP